MKYCTYCGQQLPDEARFCYSCGKPFNSYSSTPIIEPEGTLHVCPSCGKTVPSYSLKCPYCNTEFRDLDAPSALKQFSKELQQIDESTKQIKIRRRLTRKATEEATDKAFALAAERAADQKIALIQSFAIPNSKEDICEFLIMAVSNIDVKLYGNDDSSRNRRLSDAWLSKAEQTYHKAKLSFGNDPDFEQIELMYVQKMNAVKKHKILMVFLIVGLFALMIAMCFFIYLTER